MGLYAAIPEQPREDLMKAYLLFLEQRNGTIDYDKPYPKREAWLHSTVGAAAERGIVHTRFEKNYERFDPASGATAEEIALLAFVKANAGEAYGVEVITKHRHHKPVTDAFGRLERVLGQEETYHTRILLGATSQFGVPAPTGAWRPPMSQKLLITTLAYAPKMIFHPILLAAEIAGVFSFTWLLKRVGEVFRGEVRDDMQARLSEVLTDEIGHIAFNRLAVGPTGRSLARKLAPLVANETTGLTAEYAALGWNKSVLDSFDSFDLHSLPEHIVKRAFFV